MSESTAQFPGSARGDETPAPKQSHHHAKWQVVAEKLGIRLVLKQLLTQINSVNEILSQQKLYHESVLVDPDNNLLTGYPNLMMSQQRQFSFDKYREKSNAELVTIATRSIELGWQQIADFMT